MIFTASILMSASPSRMAKEFATTSGLAISMMECGSLHLFCTVS